MQCAPNVDYGSNDAKNAARRVLARRAAAKCRIPTATRNIPHHPDPPVVPTKKPARNHAQPRVSNQMRANLTEGGNGEPTLGLFTMRLSYRALVVPSADTTSEKSGFVDIETGSRALMMASTTSMAFGCGSVSADSR